MFDYEGYWQTVKHIVKKDLEDETEDNDFSRGKAEAYRRVLRLTKCADHWMEMEEKWKKLSEYWEEVNNIEVWEEE